MFWNKKRLFLHSRLQEGVSERGGGGNVFCFKGVWLQSFIYLFMYKKYDTWLLSMGEGMSVIFECKMKNIRKVLLLKSILIRKKIYGE